MKEADSLLSLCNTLIILISFSRRTKKLILFCSEFVWSSVLCPCVPSMKTIRLTCGCVSVKYCDVNHFSLLGQLSISDVKSFDGDPIGTVNQIIPHFGFWKNVLIVWRRNFWERQVIYMWCHPKAHLSKEQTQTNYKILFQWFEN